MKSRSFSFQRALGLPGAFCFCAAFALLLGSCNEKEKSGDWSGQKAPEKRAEEKVAAAPPEAVKPAPAKPPVSKAAADEDGGVRFVAYNVENWLTMERSQGGQRTASPKPETEKAAVTKVLLSAKPDIIGVSEIGKEEDVKDLQKHLADAGLSLPHFHINHGADPTRSLALLSKYPIGKTEVRDDLKYRLGGQEFGMQRGILDATVETPAGSFRFVGVHLKSKRDVQEGDQEEMRRNEAHLLRREMDEVLTQNAEARLVVYGDFNDTRNSPAIRAIQGPGKSPTALRALPLKDSRGQFWTQYWDYQDVYSRFDYVMVSQAIVSEVDDDQSKILDGEDVMAASDHRPLLVILR